MKPIVWTQFGNPILRKKAKKLSITEIQSATIQMLIQEMRLALLNENLGIGLAAPQVGQSIALAVIAIRPTLHRPKVKDFDLVLINPEIVKQSEDKKNLWEGCLSAGSEGKANLFAKVSRHKQVTVKYVDETGSKKLKSFSGLQAQVIQHEIDHLSGILFVDHVTDPKTYMTYDEYMKRVKRKH